MDKLCSTVLPVVLGAIGKVAHSLFALWSAERDHATTLELWASEVMAAIADMRAEITDSAEYLRAVTYAFGSGGAIKAADYVAGEMPAELRALIEDALAPDVAAEVHFLRTVNKKLSAEDAEVQARKNVNARFDVKRAASRVNRAAAMARAIANAACDSAFDLDRTFNACYEATKAKAETPAAKAGKRDTSAQQPGAVVTINAETGRAWVKGNIVDAIRTIEAAIKGDAGLTITAAALHSVAEALAAEMARRHDEATKAAKAEAAKAAKASKAAAA
jgi:hypothetical protein